MWLCARRVLSAISPLPHPRRILTDHFEPTSLAPVPVDEEVPVHTSESRSARSSARTATPEGLDQGGVSTANSGQDSPSQPTDQKTKAAEAEGRPRPAARRSRRSSISRSGRQRARGGAGRFTSRSQPRPEGGSRDPGCAETGRPSNPVSLTTHPYKRLPIARNRPNRRSSWGNSSPGGTGPTPRRRCAARCTACTASSARRAQQYQGIAEAFRPVGHFHQMAQQHGTTLEKALNNYVGMENKLRADPVAGLDNIVNNLGLTTRRPAQPIGCATSPITS